MATSSRRKQLTAQLEACFEEIERLSLLFRDALARLQDAALPNLSLDSAADWFRMYLRLVDLGVEIRRGELRHRSSRAIAFPCMHTTGTKGARHSGLSIDDANALYQLLDATPGVRSSQLDVYFMRMDALDRDGVGPLDEQLSACLATFLRLPSALYSRAEVSGSDPHQELLLYSGRSVAKVSRSCFGASSCLCLPDAQPWTQFRLYASDASVASVTSSSASGAALGTAAAVYVDGADDDVDVLAQSAIHAVPSHALEADEDVGLAELKRQYGFDPTLSAGPEDDAAETYTQKRRRLATQPLTGRPPQPPREIYRRKCQERGLTRKRKIEELLGVKQGCLELDLSQFGFHAPQDLQDLLDVVVEAQVPVVLVDVTNNFFDARSFEIFCDLLRLPLLRNNLRTLNLRCMALPQRPDFATLLRILTDVDTGALTQLSTLDLSYNTFFEDAVLSLNDLLNGLKSLQRLSLESCFPKAPDPGVVEVAVVKDLVRTALVSCCDRLNSLNFGSNWMSFPLLNSLFSPESALQELQLAQMTFFYFDASEAAGAPPMSWKFSFQHQQTITLSETRNSRCEYIPFFLDALTYCLKMRMSQLQHLDLWVLPPAQRKSDSIVPEMQLDDRVTGLLLAIADYGALRSLRLRFDLSPRNTLSHRSIAQLFQSGLSQCESLELALNAPLSLVELQELLSQLNAPVLRSLKLSVALLPVDGELQSVDFGRVFRSAVASLTELTLDFKVELNKSKRLLPDTVVQEMESAWRSLGEDDTHTTQSKTKQATANTRKVSLVKRKPRKDGSGADVPRDVMTFAFLFTVGASK